MSDLKAIVCVTSDLVSDQRVHRTSLTLEKIGYHVTLAGRKKKEQPVPCHKILHGHTVPVVV